MADQKWDELGERVSGIVDDAVKEQNYSSLNETISRILNDAIDSGTDALRSVINSTLGTDSRPGAEGRSQTGRSPSGTAQQGRTCQQSSSHSGKKSTAGRGAVLTGLSREMAEQYRSRPVKKKLYADVNRPTIKAGALTAGGAVFVLQALIRILTAVFGAGIGGFFGAFGFAVSMVLGAGGVYMLVRGRKTLKKIARFFKYKETAGDKSYAELKKLADAVGKDQAFVFDDLRQMIKDGWFLEGHLDEERTTLILTEETWQQYLASHDDIIRARQEDRVKKEAESKKKESVRLSSQAQEVLDRGNEYLIRLRQCNEEIPGEVMTAKISRMELLVQRIFDRVRTNPEVIPDLKKMMNYYLPTTIKLLEAYRDMDQQPVEGDNIKKAKKEIEQTIDTLNEAFERLLDAIFQDTAWDVSTDISVLNTMLAQEGLSGQPDFVRTSAGSTRSTGENASSGGNREAGAAAQTSFAGASASATAQAPEDEKENKITLTL